MNQSYSNFNGYQIDFNKLALILKDISIKKKITQADLAKGITTRNYLNKILNGKRHPSLELLYQICNRLEVDVHNILVQCHFQKYDETIRLMDEMNTCFLNYDFNTLEKLLVNHLDHVDFSYGAGKKFYLKSKGIVLLRKYQKYEDALICFDASLNLNHQDKATLNSIYIGQELSTYSQKAQCLYEMGEHDQAIRLLITILTDRNEKYESTDVRALVQTFLYLSHCLFKSNRYDESISWAKRGIDVAKLHYVFIYLGDLYRIIAINYINLSQKEKATHYYQKCYLILLAFDLKNFNEKLIKECKEFNIPLQLVNQPL